MLKSHFKRNLQFDVTCLSFPKFQFLIITPKGMSLTSEKSHCSSCENKTQILFFLNLFQQQILWKKKKLGILHLFYFKPMESKIAQGNLIISSYFFLVILIFIEHLWLAPNASLDSESMCKVISQ